MIETLLFDLDNTLLDFNQAERIAVSKTLENFQITPAPSILKRYSELNLAQWKLLEQGKISREQVKLRRFQLLFSEQNIDAPAEEAAKIYDSCSPMVIILWTVQKNFWKLFMENTACIL